MRLRSAFLSLLLPCLALPRAVAGEPLLKPNDVIALVGGEDMIAASEYGYLELLLQRALPDHKLKVRCLAWEGDTVFEQHRDLNYPSLEQQLDEIGATVVITQFGQMESLAGTSKLPEFIKAYEKLIERLSVAGKRKVIPVVPVASGESGSAYVDAIRGLLPPGLREAAAPPRSKTRDGIHLVATGHKEFAGLAAALLHERTKDLNRLLGTGLDQSRPTELTQLLETIRAKNRLWFNYYRPQNWAFLAGDRTEQPSSRDHKDPTRRWFPEEMKQYLPLIEQKEKEIWELAAKAEPIAH